MEKLFSIVYTPETIKRIQKTLEYIPRGNPSSLLVDIGCYAPMLSIYKEILGYQNVLAIANDDWAALSKEFSSILPESEFNLNVAIMDVEKTPLPLADESIDTVLLLEVLEHFSIDPVRAIAEIHRVLKWGGRLILSTPNAIASHCLRSFLAAKNPLPSPYNGIDSNRHNRIYTPQEIVNLASDCGFSVEAITTILTSDRLRSYGMYGLLNFLDRLRFLTKKNRYPLRGDIILACWVKTETIRDKTPSWLYFSRDSWEQWYQAVNKSPKQQK